MDSVVIDLVAYVCENFDGYRQDGLPVDDGLVFHIVQKVAASPLPRLPVLPRCIGSSVLH